MTLSLILNREVAGKLSEIPRKSHFSGVHPIVNRLM